MMVQGQKEIDYDAEDRDSRWRAIVAMEMLPMVEDVRHGAGSGLDVGILREETI